MFSQVITSLVQDALKQKYPAFGMWLYGSEIAAATGLAVAARSAWGLAALLYAAVTAFQLRGYLRKVPSERMRGSYWIGVTAYSAFAGFAIGLTLLTMFSPPRTGEQGMGGEVNVAEINSEQELADQLNAMAAEANESGLDAETLNAIDEQGMVNELAAMEANGELGAEGQ